jgi:hypothetical protein
MFRTLTATAALVALGATAIAGSHTDGSDASTTERGEPPFSTTTVQYGEQYLATTLIGTPVYATDADLDPMTPLADGTVDDWDNIGQIGDMIIGVEGTLEAVVIDVGAFLEMGPREIALDWSALEGVREDDDPDEWFLAITLTQEQLAEAPELERVPAQ